MRTDINRTVHSKRQTDRWITAQRNKTCHTKSALHTPHTPDTVHSVQQNGSFPLVHQVPASACVFVGGRWVTCTCVIVDRCPLKPLCRTDSCLVCTTCCWRSDCVCSAKPPTLHFSLAPYIFPAIHFIHPPTSLHPPPFSSTGLYKSPLFRTNHHPLLKQHKLIWWCPTYKTKFVYTLLYP